MNPHSGESRRPQTLLDSGFRRNDEKVKPPRLQRCRAFHPAANHRHPSPGRFLADLFGQGVHMGRGSKLLITAMIIAFSLRYGSAVPRLREPGAMVAEYGPETPNVPGLRIVVVGNTMPPRLVGCEPPDAHSK